MKNFDFVSFYRICKKRFTLKIILLIIFNITLDSAYAAKGKWYRYYDKNGVANISTRVSQDHIRHGYEVLDSNMQIVKTFRPYRMEDDFNNAKLREAQAREKIETQKAKKAFGNSSVAAKKRDAILNKITQQIDRLNLDLRASNAALLKLKQEETDFINKNKPISIDLQNRLTYNEKQIHDIKTKIQSLQTDYRNTQTEYAIIIKRLNNTE